MRSLLHENAGPVSRQTSCLRMLHALFHHRALHLMILRIRVLNRIFHLRCEPSDRYLRVFSCSRQA